MTISQCSFLCYVHARYTQQNKQNSSVIQQKYNGRVKWTVTGLHLLIIVVLLRLPNTDRLQQVDNYVRGYVNGHDSVDIITFLIHYIYPPILYIYIRNIWIKWKTKQNKIVRTTQQIIRRGKIDTPNTWSLTFLAWPEHI